MSMQTRKPRLIREEERVANWFDELSDEDRRRWFTLAEIKAAIGVPMARLQVVLYRLRWDVQRERGFELTLYRGPFAQIRRSEREAEQVELERLLSVLDDSDRLPPA
jgi:hypothetical protein